MEIGEGASLKGSLTARNPDNYSTSVIPGANIDMKTTWQPHIPVVGDATICDPSPISPDLFGFHHYWTWTMGGWKYYRVSQSHALDYVDSNTSDYIAEGDNIKKTLNATVITMAHWIALGQPIGEYWVIDADGWAYWAAPLAPGTATGLLLHKVELTIEPEDSYYYAINVISQMATKNGAQNYKDFYNNFDNDHTATDDGIDLLEIITGNKKPGNGGSKDIPAESVTINGGNKTMTVGDKYTPGCVVLPVNSTDKPIWSSSDVAVAVINSNTGEITAIGEGETTIIVTAGNKSHSIKITVIAAEISAESITINGGDRTMKVGDIDTLTCIVNPLNSTDIPFWSSNDDSVVAINSNTGEINALKKGITTITVQAGTKTHSITITVTEATDPKIDTKNGEGPYDTVYDDDDEAKNYTLIIKVMGSDFADDALVQSKIQQEGSIKLSSILAGDDYSDIGVKAQNSALSKYFKIGTDKDGSPALIYTYVSPKNLWIAAAPGLPIETISLLLTKAGCQDTPIKVTVRYNWSGYIDK
jgi:uncharacterized protein YjdB